MNPLNKEYIKFHFMLQGTQTQATCGIKFYSTSRAPEQQQEEVVQRSCRPFGLAVTKNQAGLERWFCAGAGG